jgi:hypothetical protein
MMVIASRRNGARGGPPRRRIGNNNGTCNNSNMLLCRCVPVVVVVAACGSFLLAGVVHVGNPRLGVADVGNDHHSSSVQTGSVVDPQQTPDSNEFDETTKLTRKKEVIDPDRDSDRKNAPHGGHKNQVSALAKDSTINKTIFNEQRSPPRSPTNSACDDVDGIYHIAMGDIGGAAGTIFFQFVVAQILYAERNNLKPWIHLSNVSNVVYDDSVHGSGRGGANLTAYTGRNATYHHRPRGHRRDYTPGPPDPNAPVHKQSLYFEGTGVWEHYFEPISDFVPGDRSCQDKLYVTMDLYLITPGLHGYAEYAPRCWRYKYMPDYMTKPHLGITEWLEPQRKRASEVVQRYVNPRAYLKATAAKANPGCSLQAPCLGLHIRHSDKAAGRRVVETKEFLPFAEAFVKAASAAGVSPSIYLATDSTMVLREIELNWPKTVRDLIRTAGDDLLRSDSDVAVFDLDGAKQHHRTNQEVLVEIIALSMCQFIIHGFSAVSEAAIWMDNRLHELSVNLEDPDHLNRHTFELLVEMVLSRSLGPDQWPRPVRTSDVWPELVVSEGRPPSAPAPTESACEGYDGILLISGVGRSMSTGGAFFSSILNQLLLADKHNLKPWVHLRSNHSSTALIYDDKAHETDTVSNFEMRKGMAWIVSKANDSNPSSLYATSPAKRDGALSVQQFFVQGSGIWNMYFEPVSDFVPGDSSCRGKPLLELDDVLVTPGINIYAPWAIRAWKYDGVEGGMWWRDDDGSVFKDWIYPVRVTASQLVQKYFRFRPFILQRAEKINPNTTDVPCLGVHLRNGDKGGDNRSKIPPKDFEPYVDAFERAGGRCVFVASDSHKALQYVMKNYPERLTRIIRSQGHNVVRSTKLDWPAHYIEGHHRVNSEALVDIVALSTCQLLLHGFSTLSEAAIYLNPSLHHNSVNLEDPGRQTVDAFRELAASVLSGTTRV